MKFEVQEDLRCVTEIKNFIPMNTRKSILMTFSFVSFLFMITACEPGPQDIRINEQECDHCRMMISDERFGAQLVTEQGRQYAFDAIECLAAFVNGRNSDQLDIHSLWVPDFNQTGNWISAGEAVYLQSDNLRSPMALNFSAYSSEEAALAQKGDLNGVILDWDELRLKVREAWSDGHHH